MLRWHTLDLIVYLYLEALDLECALRSDEGAVAP